MTAANDARLFADDAHRYDGAKFPTPRPFQESAHQALRQGFKEGHRRQLIAAPTLATGHSFTLDAQNSARGGSLRHC